LVIKKKGRINNDGEGSSSMMVGGRDGNEGEDAEGELYRLMRGYES
jgi:hypothetical protein